MHGTFACATHTPRECRGTARCTARSANKGQHRSRTLGKRCVRRRGSETGVQRTNRASCMLRNNAKTRSTGANLDPHYRLCPHRLLPSLPSLSLRLSMTAACTSPMRARNARLPERPSAQRPALRAAHSDGVACFAVQPDTKRLLSACVCLCLLVSACVCLCGCKSFGTTRRLHSCCDSVFFSSVEMAAYALVADTKQKIPRRLHWTKIHNAP